MTTDHAGLYGPDNIVRRLGSPAVSVAYSVLLPGTETLATLYTDRDRSDEAPNPATADTLGNVSFWADPGYYDLAIEGAAGDPLLVLVPLDPADAGGEAIVHDDLGVFDLHTQAAAIEEAAIRQGVPSEMIPVIQEVIGAIDLPHVTDRNGIVRNSSTLAAQAFVGLFLLNDAAEASRPVLHAAASQVAMLALSSAKRGDYAIRSDEGQSIYVLMADDPTSLGNWKLIRYEDGVVAYGLEEGTAVEGIALPRKAWRTGQYYGADLPLANTSISMPSGAVRATAFYNPVAGRSINEIAVDVRETFGGSPHARLYVMSDDGNGYPDEPITQEDGTPVAGQRLALPLDSSLVLPRGQLWFVAHSTGSTWAGLGFLSSAQSPHLPVAPSYSANGMSCWYATGAGTDPLTSFPAGAQPQSPGLQVTVRAA